MSNFKKVLITLLILIVIGGIAENYNESHHKEIALAKCGSQDNIAKVDSKGFECKKS